MIIGRAGASSPSRSAGAPLYIYMSSGDTAFWSPRAPTGPHATRKHKGSSITSGYLVKWGKTLVLPRVV